MFEGCLSGSACTTLRTYLSNFRLCALTLAATLPLGFAVAYFMAFHVRSDGTRTALFLLCTAPFLTSNVICMISWIPLLGREGAVNRALLGAVFVAFVAFLYGPTLTILVLSFQGPEGGLTFPMNGLSLHWYERLFAGAGVVDIWSAFGRSLRLGLAVMALTTLVALLGGYAFRRRFCGEGALFQLAVASLIVPSIAVSLGIALQFRILDDGIHALAGAGRLPAWLGAEDHTTAMGLFT